MLPLPSLLLLLMLLLLMFMMFLRVLRLLFTRSTTPAPSPALVPAPALAPAPAPALAPAVAPWGGRSTTAAGTRCAGVEADATTLLEAFVRDSVLPPAGAWRRTSWAMSSIAACENPFWCGVSAPFPPAVAS